MGKVISILKPRSERCGSTEGFIAGRLKSQKQPEAKRQKRKLHRRRKVNLTSPRKQWRRSPSLSRRSRNQIPKRRNPKRRNPLPKRRTKRKSKRASCRKRG